jgi:cyanophycinase
LIGTTILVRARGDNPAEIGAAVIVVNPYIERSLPNRYTHFLAAKVPSRDPGCGKAGRLEQRSRPMKWWQLRSILCALFVVSVCRSALAADNLLGLPTPRDARRPGALVLHGGGRITVDVFDRFVELAGGREARIVFVPCAGWRRADYDSEEEFLAALNTRYDSWPYLATSGRIRSFQFLYTDNDTDSDNAEFCKPLETATGVWFCGGQQSALNYRFQALLQKVVERGGAVGGTSAGMAALPEIMTLWDGSYSAGGPRSVVTAHGLGLLRRAIVEQHFDTRGGRLERFTGLLRDSARLDQLAQREHAGARMVGLAVEEPAALVIQGDRLQALGAGSCHVFVKTPTGKSLVWSELESGETAELRSDPGGGPAVLKPIATTTRNPPANPVAGK